MAFLYTDEQQAVGNEARRQLSARFNADALRTIVEQRKGHDIDYWRLCRECGWTGGKRTCTFTIDEHALWLSNLVSLQCGRIGSYLHWSSKLEDG